VWLPDRALRQTFETRLWRVLPRLAEADRDRALTFLIGSPQQPTQRYSYLSQRVPSQAVAPVSEILWKRLITDARTVAEQVAGMPVPEPRPCPNFSLFAPVISTLPERAVAAAVDDLLDLFAEVPAKAINLTMSFRGGKELRTLVQRLSAADQPRAAGRMISIIGSDLDPERSELVAPMLSTLLPMLPTADRDKYQSVLFELLRRAVMAKATSPWHLAEAFAASVANPSGDDVQRFLDDLSAVAIPEQSEMLVLSASSLVKMIPQMSASQLQECWKLLSSAAVRVENQNDLWMAIMDQPFWLLARHLSPAAAAEACGDMAGMPAMAGRPLVTLTPVVAALPVCGPSLTQEQAVSLRTRLIAELQSVDDSTIQQAWRQNASIVRQLLQVLVERSGTSEDAAVVGQLFGLLKQEESFGEAAAVIAPAIDTLLARAEQPLVVQSWQTALAAVRAKNWRGAESISLFETSYTAAGLLRSASRHLVGSEAEQAWLDLLQLLGPADAPPESGVVSDGLTPVLIGPALRALASQTLPQDAIRRFQGLFKAVPYHSDFSDLDSKVPHSGMFLGAAEPLARKLNADTARELGNWLIADGQRSAAGIQNLAWQVVIPRLATDDAVRFWDLLYQQARTPDSARLGAIPQSLLSARLSPEDAAARWSRILSDLDGAGFTETTARICEFIPGLIDRVGAGEQEKLAEPLLKLIHQRLVDSPYAVISLASDRLLIAAIVSVALRMNDKTRSQFADSVLQTLFSTPLESRELLVDDITLVFSSSTQLASYLARPDCQSGLRPMLLKRFEELVLFDGRPRWHLIDDKTLLSADPFKLTPAAKDVETPDQEIERRRRESEGSYAEIVAPDLQPVYSMRQIETLFDVAAWLEKNIPDFDADLSAQKTP